MADEKQQQADQEVMLKHKADTTAAFTRRSR